MASFQVSAKCVLAILCLIHVGCALKVSPPEPVFFIPKHVQKELMCSTDEIDKTVSWKVPDTLVKDNDYKSVSDGLSERLVIKMFDISKHSGLYICEMKDVDGNVVGNHTTELVGVKEDFFQPELMMSGPAGSESVLTDPLSCNISIVGNTKYRVKPGHIPVWEKNNTEIKLDDSKYIVSADNSVINIKDVQPADLGTYVIVHKIIDNDKKKPKEYTYKCAVSVVSPPFITEKLPECKNVIEGKKVQIQCKIAGYPTPTLTWTRDGKKLNGTINPHKLTMKPSGEYKDAILVIEDAEFEDSGNYTCTAFSLFYNSSESTQMMSTISQSVTVGVKDKYAAVWPFLGIVAEVVILCSIIFVYEKRRNAKAARAEMDAQDDQCVEPKSKVRNRRNQSS